MGQFRRKCRLASIPIWASTKAVEEAIALSGERTLRHGGRFLARGNPVKAYEAGLNQRLVIIEFESVKKAIEAYESAEHQF
jgi:uncharacterized protein (DUF1330 family)